MKNLMKRALLGVVILAMTACQSSSAKFGYIPLQNNVNGFTTTDADTAIAIGLKKDSPLKAGIDAYLSSLEPEYWTSLMGQMVALKNDDNATYTYSNPNFTPTNPVGGTFKVGMECAYDPYNWTQGDDSNGAVPIANVSGKFANGYDVQIARQVAFALGATLEVYQYEWDALIPGLQSGAIDGIVAGMSPTAERLQEIDFSAIYYQSNLVIITKDNSKLLECKSLAEVDQKGIKIAAQPGTFHLNALRAQTSNLTVIDNLEDFVSMRIALVAGTIDGYVAEEPTALTFCK